MPAGEEHSWTKPGSLGKETRLRLVGTAVVKAFRSSNCIRPATGKVLVAGQAQSFKTNSAKMMLPFYSEQKLWKNGGKIPTDRVYR